MDKTKIINFLQQNGLSDISELDNKSDVLALRFYYDFDDEEMEAARAYSNDESDDEEEGDIWYEEFFLQYLSDIAVDNVGDIIEDLMEDENIEAQFVSYDIDKEEHSYNEFIGIFYDKGRNINIDDVLAEL